MSKEVDVVQIAVDDILDLVNCAEIYGHSNPIILEAFASWLDYSLSDADIEAHAHRYLTPESQGQGYTEEDRNSAIEALTDWRDKYCTEEKQAALAELRANAEKPV